MIELHGLTAEQQTIADKLWAANEHDEVVAIIAEHGIDGRIVYELLIAAGFDEQVNTADDCTYAAFLIGEIADRR